MTIVVYDWLMTADGAHKSLKPCLGQLQRQKENHRGAMQGKKSVRQLWHLNLICFLDMLSYAMLSPLVTILFLDGPESLFSHTGISRHFLFGLYLAVFSLVQIFSVPLWGRLSLRISKKEVLKVSFLGNMTAYILGGFGVLYRFPLLLFFGIFLAGLTGAILPTLNALMSEQSGPARWGKNFSLMGATIGLAFILGPQITAYLLNFYDGQVLCSRIFFFCAFLSVANFCYATLALQVGQATSSLGPGLPSLFRRFRQDLKIMGSDVKKILTFQFLIFLGWYFFIKFFQIYLIESRCMGEKESCYGISYLGLCCAVWQCGRFFFDHRLARIRFSLFASTIVMCLSILSFILIEHYVAVMIAILLLSFSYALVVPSTLSLLLGAGVWDAEMKTSMYQTMQSAAKIIAPLISGIVLSYASWASAFIGALSIALAAGLVYLNQTIFCPDNIQRLR